LGKHYIEKMQALLQSFCRFMQNNIELTTGQLEERVISYHCNVEVVLQSLT